jgi:hypothetical protein
VDKGIVRGPLAGRIALAAASGALAAALAGAAPAAVVRPAPQLFGLRVANSSAPFAGDGPLLTTVTPNGDGRRDRAIVSFRLLERAIVRLDVVRTDSVKRAAPSAIVIWTETVRLRPGRHRLVWKPSPDTPARTYVLRLMVTGAGGASSASSASPPRSRGAATPRETRPRSRSRPTRARSGSRSSRSPVSLIRRRRTCARAARR